MFKQNFIKLCNDRGESPSFVCKNIGLSNAAFSTWTDESVPRKATLMRIADYFGVTVESLTEESPSPKTQTDNKAEEILKKLNIDKMDDKQLEMLTKYAEFLVSQSDKE